MCRELMRTHKVQAAEAGWLSCEVHRLPTFAHDVQTSEPHQLEGEAEGEGGTRTSPRAAAPDYPITMTWATTPETGCHLRAFHWVSGWKTPTGRIS